MTAYEKIHQFPALRLFPCYYDILVAKYLAKPKGTATDNPLTIELVKQGISITLPNDI
jgi:hypothetical protein